MFDSTQPNTCLPPVDDLGAKLHRIAQEVAALAHPIEPLFLSLAEALTSAKIVLDGAETDFTVLAELLNSADCDRSAAELSVAVEKSAALAGDGRAIAECMVEVEGAIGATKAPVALLSKVVNEVGALAINAKIQASLVDAAGIDFSVFTTEIGRLHGLAAAAIEQADIQIVRLDDAIVSARTAEDEFKETAFRHLGAVQHRLEANAASLAGRRRRAMQSLGDVSRDSRRISQRVADGIIRMQLGDMTSQRIVHVREAIEMLHGIVVGGHKADIPAECAILLERERRDALVAVVLRLQVQQLGRAVRDFAGEVAQLKDDIQCLADDVGCMMAEAMEVFGGGVGKTAAEGIGMSFATELRQQADEAIGQLEHYTGLRRLIQGLVTKVLSGLDEMSANMEVVRSIDADMRIMGLNASLKCGRLGSKGRALVARIS